MRNLRVLGVIVYSGTYRCVIYVKVDTKCCNVGEDVAEFRFERETVILHILSNFFSPFTIVLKQIKKGFDFFVYYNGEIES